MKSESLGTSTSAVEVTNISRHGLWLMVEEEELFLSFDEFPWFMDAPITAVLKVEKHGANHIQWPALDVDLTLESIRHPEQYPLISRLKPQTSAQESTLE
jgi:hypothetical protein